MVSATTYLQNWFLLMRVQINIPSRQLFFPTQAHLSDVYWGKSKVNNNTPRSVTNPPPWANLDPRVLSPIPDKKKREARWDESFYRGNCLQRNEVKAATTLRKRPASAGVRRGQQELAHTHHGISSDDGLKKSQGRVRRRPSSANERGRHVAYGGGDGGGGGGGGGGDGALKVYPLPAVEAGPSAPYAVITGGSSGIGREIANEVCSVPARFSRASKWPGR